MHHESFVVVGYNWVSADFVFIFLESKGNYLRTHLCMVSGSSWTVNTFILRTHAQEKSHILLPSSQFLELEVKRDRWGVICDVQVINASCAL